MRAHRKHLSSTEQRLQAEEARMEQDFGAPNPHESHALAEKFVARLKEELELVERRREAMALDEAQTILRRIAAKR
ncbi:MAG TPA: hypothetical protein VKZ48_04900 [Burkholderiales bacterium]|nr:hypothetical protein [Burkholderiales bacterium]